MSEAHVSVDLPLELVSVVPFHAAIVGDAPVTTRSTRDRLDTKECPPMLILPDCSEFQQIVEWPAVAAYLRATYGGAAAVVRISNGYRPDQQVDRNIDQARANCDVVGWYAYLVAGVAPAVQADIFCRVLQAHGGLLPGEFIVCDCEEGAGDLSSSVNAFLDRCDATLQIQDPDNEDWWYSGRYFASAHLPNSRGRRWIAAYGPQDPGMGRDLWQFTSGGSLPGIAGQVDLSRFDGELADLKAIISPPTPDPGGTAMFRPAGPGFRFDTAYLWGGHVWHLWADGSPNATIADEGQLGANGNTDRGNAPGDVPFMAILSQGWDQKSGAFNVIAQAANGQLYWAFWPFDPNVQGQDWTPMSWTGGIVQADVPRPSDQGLAASVTKLAAEVKALEGAIQAASHDLGSAG